MASNYPGGLDALSTAHADGVNEVVHAADVNNLADAVNKIEAELGVLPKGTYASVVARLADAIYKSLFTTKGDLVAALANDSVSRLGLGTNGQVLTVDTTTPTGLKYATPGSGALPSQWINLHAAAYSTPTDGTTDATAAINLAIADVPIGGALLFGPYTYTISGANGINLSTRPDITLVGAGGGPLANSSAPYPGTVLQTTGTMNAITVSPATLTQRGPKFVDIHVLDGAATATGWLVSNINFCTWTRCSVKYAAKGWYFNGGSDNAWHDLYSCTAFQCVAGVHCNSNFGLRFHGGQLFAGTNSHSCVLLTGQAQSNKFLGTFFDGATTGGIGNGIGVSVDTTNAHENEFIFCKMEALSKCAQLRSSGSPPTQGIRFIGGSMSAFAGTEQMIDIGASVAHTLIDHVSFPSSNTYALMVLDGGTDTTWNFDGDEQVASDNFAAAYTPTSYHLGRTKSVGAMTANITAVGAIPDGRAGNRAVLIFTQDGTGGRTLPAAGSWTGYALQAVSNTGNTANKRTAFEFVYVGATWVQVGGPNVWF